MREAAANANALIFIESNQYRLIFFLNIFNF